MKVLIADTESTGLFDYRKRADEDGQPRIAQLAMVLLDVNDDWSEVHTEIDCDFLIRPEGWEMPADLVEKLGHGLTQARLLADGIPIEDALDRYLELFRQCELIAGFNIEYDLKLIRGELRRLGQPDHYAERPVFCAMRAATPICQIPKAKGGGYKFPKLSEAFPILCGEEITGTHNAEDDVRSTIRVLTALRARGVEIVGKEQPRKLLETVEA